MRCVIFYGCASEPATRLHCLNFVYSIIEGAIVNFLDHISSAKKYFLLNDMTEEKSNIITRKHGETNTIFSLNGISNDELVKIIARDLKEGKLNARNSKQTNRQTATQTSGKHTGCY